MTATVATRAEELLDWDAGDPAGRAAQGLARLDVLEGDAITDDDEAAIAGAAESLQRIYDAVYDPAGGEGDG